MVCEMVDKAMTPLSLRLPVWEMSLINCLLERGAEGRDGRS